MLLKDFFMPDEISYHYHLEPSTMPYAHAHPKYELYFCPERTKQRSIINGNEYVYDFPCAIISSPYTMHSMSSVEEGRYERMVIYFGEYTLSQFGPRVNPTRQLKNSPAYFFELTERQGAVLKDLILPAMKQKHETSNTEKELVLMLFLNKLLEVCPKEKITEIGTSNLYIQDVLKYILENFHLDLTVDSIAAHFAVSRSKLDRDFKQFSDSTTHDFLESCRLNNAKKLLLSGKCKENIGDISRLCGFQSDTYFYSFFRKHTGVSPNEYKKLCNLSDIYLDPDCP